MGYAGSVSQGGARGKGTGAKKGPAKQKMPNYVYRPEPRLRNGKCRDIGADAVFKLDKKCPFMYNQFQPKEQDRPEEPAIIVLKRKVPF